MSHDWLIQCSLELGQSNVGGHGRKRVPVSLLDEEIDEWTVLSCGERIS